MRPKATKRRVKVVAGRGARSTRPETATVTSAVISINGSQGEKVDVGRAFPASRKIFRLISLKPGVAKIGVVGGTLVGGGTVSLHRGKPLTLMNTADGSRYRIRLLSIG